MSQKLLYANTTCDTIVIVDDEMVWKIFTNLIANPPVKLSSRRWFQTFSIQKSSESNQIKVWRAAAHLMRTKSSRKNCNNFSTKAEQPSAVWGSPQSERNIACIGKKKFSYWLNNLASNLSDSSFRLDFGRKHY